MSRALHSDFAEVAQRRRDLRARQKVDPFAKRMSLVAYWHRRGDRPPYSRILYRSPGFIPYLLPNTAARIRDRINQKKDLQRAAWSAESEIRRQQKLMKDAEKKSQLKRSQSPQSEMFA